MTLFGLTTASTLGDSTIQIGSFVSGGTPTLKVALGGVVYVVV
jgi:hypothetical protein